MAEDVLCKAILHRENDVIAKGQYHSAGLLLEGTYC